MTHGAAYLGSFVNLMRDSGFWSFPRGQGLLDGGAPFYTTYQCCDGGLVAVGAIEAQFYRALLQGLGCQERMSAADQMDSTKWEHTRQVFAGIFMQKSQEEWCKVFEGTDACVTPVLRPEQLHEHPLHIARGTFAKGSTAVTPAPVLHEFQEGTESTAAGQRSGSARARDSSEGVLAAGTHTSEVLKELLPTLSQSEMQELVSKRVVGIAADADGQRVQSGNGIQFPPPSTSKL